MTELDPVYYTDPNAKPPKPVRRASAGRLLTVAIVTLLSMCVLTNVTGRVLKQLRTVSPAEEQRLQRVEAALIQFDEDVRRAFASTSTSEEYAEASRRILDESILRVERVAIGRTIADHAARATIAYLKQNRPEIEAYLDLVTEAERSGAFDSVLASSPAEVEANIQILGQLADMSRARRESARNYSSFLRDELEAAGFTTREVDRASANARSSLYSSGALRIHKLDIEIMEYAIEAAEVLLRSWGSWSYNETDGLMFDRDEDVDRYNELFERMEEAVAEQEAIMLGN